MKFKNLTLPHVRGLACALACAAVGSHVAVAMPYATCLTNNAGVISFRLNESADNVKIIWNGGANTNDLGAKTKGVTVTANLGVTGNFFVQVSKTGNGGVIVTNSPVIPFNSPRGVAVNKNPKSPYFGRVYVANSAAGSKGDGIYLYNADLSNVGANTNQTGGLDFGKGGTSSPYRITVGEEDDLLYICDWSDANGNLFYTDADVTTNGYALKPLGPCLNGTVNAAMDGGNPVGYDNNHGSLAAVAVTGSMAKSNLTIFTVDEDLQQDRANVDPVQMNSAWRYDVGAGPFPYTDFYTNYLGTPGVGFVSQTMDLARGPNGWIYVSDYRSTGNEMTLFVADSQGTRLFNSYQISRAIGSSTDLFRACGGIAVSSDGRFIAHVNIENNVVTVYRLTNGVPDLTRAFQYTSYGTTGNARGLAFDAADNLYFISSGIATFQSLSLGLTGTTVSGSDGSFVLNLPPIVSVTATTNVAHRMDQTGNFTFFRDGDLSVPLTARYTIGGTATNGVQYVRIDTNVTFAAGQASVDVPVTPLPSTQAMPLQTVVVTLVSQPTYNLADSKTATVTIADNQTPQLSITRNYINMYERLDKDFCRFTVTRIGETNVQLSIPLEYSGGGTHWVDYQGPDSIMLNAGAITTTVDLNPYYVPATLGGVQMPIVSLAAATGGEYTLTNATATFNLFDSDFPAETQLFAEDFDAYYGTATNTVPAGWSFKFGSTNNVADYNFTFGYDYSADGIPAAPGTNISAASSTYGLRATVNKYDTIATAAALNFYPNNKTFSGSYAVRFNMITINGAVNGTEHALFGINHSGTKTNWFRNGGLPAGMAANMDGLFFAVNSAGGNSWDYSCWVPGLGTVNNPNVITNRSSANTVQVFKNTTLANGPYAATGAPGCAYNGAKNWVDVEVDNTPGLVTLRMNGQVILQSTNITASSGNIMLGYCDAFDSIGDYTNAAVIFDNLRVVRIVAPTITTQPVSTSVLAGGTATFSVVASSTTGTLNYQWFRNGAPIAGANQASLTITNAQTANAGAYTVLVDDGKYQSSSAAALLSITVPTAPKLAISVSGTAVSLKFDTVAGPTYYLEYKAALSDTTWTALTSSVGTGSPVTLPDTLTTGPRFYRLRVQ